MIAEKRLLNRRQFLAILPKLPMAILGKATHSPSKPKFSLGDYVEMRADCEGVPFWERGIIKGIISPDWYRNTTKNQWLYYYEIENTSYGSDFNGQTGESFEDELTLVSL